MTSAARQVSAPRDARELPPGARGREEVRARILRAALELFGQDGFETTTVRTIARRCNLSDAALYYYFRSKRDILDALWDIPQARILREVDPARPLTVARLLELVDDMITASASMDAIVRLMIRQSLSQDRAAAAFRRRTVETWRRDVRSHFLTVLGPDEAEVNTDLLVALVFSTTFSAQVQSGKDYPNVARAPQFRDHVRDLLRSALPFCRESNGR